MAGLESLERAVQAVRHRNKQSQKTEGNSITVTARVVSPPIPFNTADADLLYGDPSANREKEASRVRRGLDPSSASRMAAFVFRGYIVDTDWPQNPHKLIPNPCSMAEAQGAQIADIEDTIKLCTKFVSEEGYSGQMPKVGDWVKVRLNKIRQPGNNEGSWNTALGDFVTMAETEDIPAEATNADPQCSNLVSRFMNQPPISLGDSVAPGDPGNLYWSNRAKQKTTTWNSTEFPQWNGTVLRNGEIEPGALLKTDSETGAQLVSPALDDFKLLAAAYKAKFNKVLRVSGYRSYSSQVNVRMIRAAGDHHAGGDGSGNQQYNEAGKFVGFAAVPGTSNHGWAAAVDINRSDWAGHPFPGKNAANFIKANESPKEFRWLNRYAARWNFVFGVRNEHWHLDWMKFGQQVGGSISTRQTAWTTGGQNDSTVTLT